ncbi:glutathione S-transferase [Sagittula marina]|uniref:Glutathione S-transferase n=1 Tax=Sagittula marina TaxID=943940 RepID=A0A7W6DT42_9RHOB|nr:glutathione S-transferase family protein [Sagittula marina]MBB3984734.1 glutathione S-transferase [Sagittula marina]
MMTLYHSPMSRSSRLVTLIDDLGAQDHVDIHMTSIKRSDGSGAADPANPHPDKKVPALDHDGTVIVESIAIAQHLCDVFPDAGLMPAIGTPDRAKCLEWLAWNAGVVEPVTLAKMAGIDNPLFQSTFRGWDDLVERLTTTLGGQPWLLGETYSVADLMVHSLFNWMPDLLPDHDGVRDWHERMQARPSAQRTWQRDQAAMAA